MGVRYVEHVFSVVKEAGENEEMLPAMTKKATLPFLLSDNMYNTIVVLRTSITTVSVVSKTNLRRDEAVCKNFSSIFIDLTPTTISLEEEICHVLEFIFSFERLATNDPRDLSVSIHYIY